MEDYARIPSQQFSNIVKRYIQHRKATELRGLKLKKHPSLVLLFTFRSYSK